MKCRIFLFLALAATAAFGQTSAAKDIGSGAATIGKGTAGAVGHLATGHPINAAASLGKGVGKGGARLALGTAKGTGALLKKLTHL